MIDGGQLDGVEAIIGLHNKPDLPVGTIGLKEGPLMAAVDRISHYSLWKRESCSDPTKWKRSDCRIRTPYYCPSDHC